MVVLSRLLVAVVEMGRVVGVRVEQKRLCLAALFSRVDLA